MTKEEERRKRGDGKVAFWKHKESIKNMLDDKYTLTATYLEHKKDVNIKYQQFRRYVKEFIPESQEGKKQEPRRVKAEVKPKGKSTTEFLNEPVNKEDII